MSKTRAFIAGGIGTATLLAAGALPAYAAPGDTVTTFSLQAGTLSVAVAPSAGLPAGNSGQAFVSGQLGPVNVTDNRGSTISWTAYAKTTLFSTFNGQATTNSTSVEYNTGTPSKTGEVTVEGTSQNVLLAAAPSPVVNGSAVVGNNTASWDPMLKVNLPTNSLAGSYEGTITTSVT